MNLALQLFTASLTLLSVHMAGKNDQRFNFLGLFNQALWLIVILQSKTYGLLILTVAMTITYSNNIRRNYGSRIHWHKRGNDASSEGSR